MSCDRDEQKSSKFGEDEGEQKEVTLWYKERRQMC